MQLHGYVYKTGMGEVLPLFYSLIETAKLCGAEPKSYLLRATSEALDHPGAVTFPNSSPPA